MKKRKQRHRFYNLTLIYYFALRKRDREDLRLQPTYDAEF